MKIKKIWLEWALMYAIATLLIGSCTHLLFQQIDEEIEQRANQCEAANWKSQGCINFLAGLHESDPVKLNYSLSQAEALQSK